ncbi:MAG: HEAT repeat domain-containing protein, partial [Myxococcota bacterium]
FSKELVRVMDEVIAVGEPCAPFLVDWMILDEIRVPALEKQTGGKAYLTDDLTRQDCLHMLESIGPPACPWLLAALRREDLGVKGRRLLALAAGGTRDARAYEPLVKLLRGDASWEVRADAATGLAKLGDRRALAPLQEAVEKDPDSAVVKRAGRARSDLLRAASRQG